MDNDTILGSDYDFGTGTSSFINDKIEIELNEYGEYKSKLRKKLTKEEEKNIQKVSLNSPLSPNENDISRELYEGVQGIKYDKRLGYYKGLYAGHVVEGDYRENASSGGFGTWIFKELFRKNLIDGVIHVKENQNKNDSILFKYDISTSIKEIQEGAKTKYYPVEFSKVLKKIKEKPGRYAIIGTPSFIMSIRLLAQQDPIINDRIKFTIGLICGHQKSAKFAEYLAWQVGIEPGNLKTIDFRKKIPGLPASSYGVEMIGRVKDEEVKITKSMNDFLGANWGQGFFKASASDFTDDVMNETADVTLGDAWLPEYVTDSLGNNILVVRDNIIGNIIEEGIEKKKIKIDVIDVETVVKSQSSHFQHTIDELGYRLYKKDSSKQWRPEKRVPANKKIPFFRKQIQDLRMNVFKESHISYKKAIELNDLDYFISHMRKYVKKYERLYFLKSVIEMGPKKFMVKAYKKVSRRN